MKAQVADQTVANQEALAGKFDALVEEILCLESLCLHKLDELKKSLLHQAFSGQL